MQVSKFNSLVLVCFVVVFSLSLTGCGSSDPSVVADPSELQQYADENPDYVPSEAIDDDGL